MYVVCIYIQTCVFINYFCQYDGMSVWLYAYMWVMLMTGGGGICPIPLFTASK